MKASKIIGGLIKLGAVAGAVGGTVAISQKSIKKEKALHDRFRQYYELTNQWILNKNDERSIDSFFEENNYKTIAIYGMGTMGELFYQELDKNKIKVAYFIDKNAEELYYGLDDLPVVGFEDIRNQDEVDVTIITPIYDFDEISKDLEAERVKGDIISLEDIIFGI